MCVYVLSQLEYDRKKKEEGKRARADKQQVLDILFSAFEKHQYYNIKDLVDITKQPVVKQLLVLQPLLHHYMIALSQISDDIIAFSQTYFHYLLCLITLFCPDLNSS